MTRIAYLSYSSAEWDSRTQRMARTAVEAGYDATVYARWEPGLPLDDDKLGYRLVRVPTIPDLAIPGRRAHGRKRLAGALRRARRESGAAGAGTGPPRLSNPDDADELPQPDVDDNLAWVPTRLRGTPFGRPLRAGRRILRTFLRSTWNAMVHPVMLFPLRPTGWAIALEDVAEPADIWHGMWAGSLPALDRLQKRHGGRTVYDSRDVYMRSRGFEQMGVFKAPFAWLERRWARRADAVLTVNDAYSGLLASQFHIEPPPVVRNTPDRYVPPTPQPDLIRTALGLDRNTRVVLYQGGLLSDRGIEQGMEAILLVENAIFAIMGVGKPTPEIDRLATSDRMRGRVHLVDPVPPDELLDWTASADVMLMAIQPTSVNHRFTTPQKLWEAIAAGVPVVASDLPGMAQIVREVDCGALIDATDPADIARGIRSIIDAPPDERRAMRERTWRAGQDRYNWQRETDTLLGLYEALLDRPQADGRSPVSRSISAT